MRKSHKRVETYWQADMLEATGDTEGAKAVRKKLREQRKAYREYSNEHGLSVHNDRLTVVKVRNGDSSYKNIYGSGLTESGRSGIINMAKQINMFNDNDLPSNAEITAKQIIDDMLTTKIGRETVNDLDSLPELIKLTYEPKEEWIRGENDGNSITIFLRNCTNVSWASRTVIHEVTHYKYGIGQSHWAECVCVAQELKHARNRDYLTTSELRTIIKAVKEAYPDYNWRKGGIINGRRKSH